METFLSVEYFIQAEGGGDFNNTQIFYFFSVGTIVKYCFL